MGEDLRSGGQGSDRSRRYTRGQQGVLLEARCSSCPLGVQATENNYRGLSRGEMQKWGVLKGQLAA